MSEATHPNIFPSLRYADAATALEWLKTAFDFAEKSVYRGDDGSIQHAELQLGAGLVMFGQYREDGWLGGTTPNALASPAGIYIVVDDPDAHYTQAKQAGARIVRELVDEEYGSRGYSARDLEGNLWSFGTYDPYASVQV
jgi:uncharacterized glyoxalase superfamily protein PhnB